MKSLGWKQDNQEPSQNKTFCFLNPNQENSRKRKSPIYRLLEQGLVIPDSYGENESFGKILFNFWIKKLDSDFDKILAQVAIGILSCFCTSCSAERLFSKAGRILTRDRMRLMPEVAESQVIIMANKELADKCCTFD